MPEEVPPKPAEKTLDNLTPKELEEIQKLSHLVFTSDIYYHIMLSLEGRKSPKTQIALGTLTAKIKAFTSYLTRIGIDPAPYNNPTAITKLWKNHNLEKN